MMRTNPYAILATLALALSACGGSGSTGLITAEDPVLVEDPVLIEVRETGDCRDANGTTYCPAEVPTNVISPAPTPETNGFVEFDTSNIDAGTSCAPATREPNGSWSVSTLQIIDDDNPFILAPTSQLQDGPTEVALLCFDLPPEELPETTETLAELGPTIIYVAPVQ